MAKKYECLVSIGICTYDQKSLCRNLVQGLIRYGPKSMRIFVWDNKPDKPFLEDIIKEDPRVEVHLDPLNQGYIIPNNRMATMCNSKYHIVSNDDIIVEKDWFEAVERAFDDPALAVVGGIPRFGALNKHFFGQPFFGKPEYIEGWWMAIPREIIDRYGLFDETNLKTATCEDSHFCLSLQEMGWKIKAVSSLPVKHLWHQTKKANNNYNWGQENSIWASQRWEKYLQTRSFPKHTVLINANLSEEELRQVRWKYPYSKLFLVQPQPIFDLVDGLVGLPSNDYSVIIDNH